MKWILSFSILIIQIIGLVVIYSLWLNVRLKGKVPFFLPSLLYNSAKAATFQNFFLSFQKCSLHVTMFISVCLHIS